MIIDYILSYYPCCYIRKLRWNLATRIEIVRRNEYVGVNYIKQEAELILLLQHKDGRLNIVYDPSLHIYIYSFVIPFFQILWKLACSSTPSLERELCAGGSGQLACASSERARAGARACLRTYYCSQLQHSWWRLTDGRASVLE